MPKLIFRLFFSFIVFVSLFILIQRLVTPDSFGKYGHYRANSLEDNKMRTSYYKGEKKCTECHQEVYDLKATDVHDGVRCESCHSPKIAGTIDCKVNPPIVKGTILFCAQCHAKINFSFIFLICCICKCFYFNTTVSSARFFWEIRTL